MSGPKRRRGRGDGAPRTTGHLPEEADPQGTTPLAKSTSTRRARLELAADRALAAGRFVQVDGLLLVPDVLVAEGIANGSGDLPPTVRITRSDGRSVWVFRDPEAAA